MDPRDFVPRVQQAQADVDDLRAQLKREQLQHAANLDALAHERELLLGELLLEPLRETVRRRTLVSSVAAVDIRTSELGPRSVAVGAATQVLKAALNDSRIFPNVAADSGHSAWSAGA